MSENYLVYLLHVGKDIAETFICDKKTALKLFKEYGNDASGVESIWIGKVEKQYWRGKETRERLFKTYCEAQNRLWGSI